MEKKKLEHLKQLQKEIPSILEEYGKNTDLARAAMVNPILALEKIGYELSDELKHEIDYHVRFGPEKKKTLLKLENEIFKEVGSTFDLQDEKEIRKNIHPLISLKENAILTKPSTKISIKSKSATSNKTSKQEVSFASPYEAFANSHKVIPKLVEFQTLQANVPKLGTEILFKEALKKDELGGLKINSIRFRLQDKHLNKS